MKNYKAIKLQRVKEKIRKEQHECERLSFVEYRKNISALQ